MKRRIISKSVAALLTAAVTVSVIPVIAGSTGLKADEGWTKTQQNIALGTAQIAAPTKPASAAVAWHGDYVYFGKYGGNPIKFRVLSPNTSDYCRGMNSMFLDSDSILFSTNFDSSFADPIEIWTNKWKDSNVRTILNGEFITAAFSKGESDAIAESYKGGSRSYSDSYGEYNFEDPVNIDDKVFLLDIDEICNPNYGYFEDCGWTAISQDGPTTDFASNPVINHVKSSGMWWLRAESKYGGAGVVTNEGILDAMDVPSSIGVAPALNIDLDDVLFSSCVLKSDVSGSDYKLTVIDNSLFVGLFIDKPCYRSGNDIVIPYEIAGADAANATQVSVLILDKEYSAGNKNAANILYYGALSGDLATIGTGSFTLPSNLNIAGWNKDYFVYIMAEDVNGIHETDYVSSPFLLGAPADNPPSSMSFANDEVTIVCGDAIELKNTLKGASGNVAWKSSDKKVAAVDANGKVTGKMAGTVTITASESGQSAECKVTVLYKDVTKAKDFWYAPTNYLTGKGVVKGYDKQTTFKPANMCTRAQMVTFIWRLMGEPDPKAKTCKFKDVKKTDYFYKACIWGNENHIVEGYKDGTFGPQIVCARKHAVTFLWRLAGQPSAKSSKNPFKDVKQKDYFYKATLWASEMKILAGYSDGTFKPDGDCLRRQMVTFLYKYDKYVNGKG